jgi:glutaconate CoA-transferase subunit A
MATFYDTLSAAVADLLHDGDTVALEGFTHLIPSAAGHEIVRQGRRHLTLIRLTPDVIYDQLIGMGIADRLIFSWGGNPGVGSLHRFRDAVERGRPHPIEIEEHSHAGLTNAYVAGASGLPFGIIRGYLGGDLVRRGGMLSLRCPFTDEELIAVPAVRPDLTVIHAQQADRRGNVMFWGMSGVHKEAVLAARRALVTVEEVVDEFRPQFNGVVLPGWVISGVAVVPRGAHPSYAMGYDARDNDFYRAWDPISRDRETFLHWMRTHVLGTRDHAEYLESIGAQIPAASREVLP